MAVCRVIGRRHEANAMLRVDRYALALRLVISESGRPGP
jgi:hypothetical protein